MQHVIVVEDDPLNAVLMERLLHRRGGYRVTVTEDAETLFSLVRDPEVVLVVMDVSLSGTTFQGRQVDGVALTRMLRDDPGTRHLPVLLATAHAMRGDRDSLLVESGADGYVSKPILDQDAFIEQVRALVAACEMRT